MARVLSGSRINNYNNNNKETNKMKHGKKQNDVAIDFSKYLCVIRKKRKGSVKKK